MHYKTVLRTNSRSSPILYALGHDTHGVDKSVGAVVEAFLLARVQAVSACANALLDAQLSQRARLQQVQLCSQLGYIHYTCSINIILS
jgi:hypothetical protein